VVELQLSGRLAAMAVGAHERVAAAIAFQTKRHAAACRNARPYRNGGNREARAKRCFSRCAVVLQRTGETRAGSPGGACRKSALGKARALRP
jgi:hypothetical protein